MDKDDERDFSFSLGMNIASVYPFSRDDGTDPIVKLEVDNASPMTALAALNKMKHDIQEDETYIFSCLYADAIDRYKDDLGMDPKRFRELLNDFTQWIRVVFPVDIFENHNSRTVNVIVEAPGYGYIINSLAQFLNDENLDTIMDQVIDTESMLESWNIDELD